MNNYNRENAVRYAMTYAMKPNPMYRYFNVHGDGGGDCSNFISQCLLAGGAPMDYKSSRPWWYKNKGTPDGNNDTWSVSWAVAHSLYWCLKVRGEQNLPGLKGIEVPDVSMLELGDVIQYENIKGMIYHSTIVTAFGYLGGMRVPFVTQHTFNGVNVFFIKPAAKKMHYMKIVV